MEMSLKNIILLRNVFWLIINVFFKVVGFVFCFVFVLEVILIVVGNLFIIVFFVVNRNFCKKNLLLIVNMVFVDLMLGIVFLFMYIYLVGVEFKFWLYRKDIIF